LILKNDAVIENAINAVTLWKPGDWDMRGGIIFAKDAVFRNNKRSVEFMSYQNFHPVAGDLVDYNSHFTNCSFVVDDNYKVTEPDNFQAHITAWGVNGISFKGCSFTNLLSSATDRKQGIFSLDAGFSISSYCDSYLSPCPEPSIINSYFSGFNRAIESANSATALNQVRITETDFENNGTALYFSSINDAVVLNNNFKLGVCNDCNPTVGTGIFMDNCKRFAVEENNFKLLQNAPPAHYVGIHTLNTNNAFDEIYKNDFDDMILANYAEGKNWWGSKDNGLTYYCNINQNNVWDFVVERKGNVNDIQLLQGSRSYSAGNTFSTGATKHFYNNGDDEITYYHENGNDAQTPTFLYRVKPEPIQYTNTCPSHYGGGGDIRMSITEYQQRENDYNNALVSYNTASTNYIAANDSTTRAYWADKMTYYNMLLSRAAYDILRNDMADTLVQTEKFEAWQAELNTYASVESVIDLYLQQGDFVTAMNKVDSLQIDFVFDAYDSIEYPYYQNLKNMQATLMGQGRTVFELTTSEINSLSAIANNSRGSAGAQARGILTFAYDSLYSYVNCIALPGSSNKSAEFNNGSENKNSKLTVSVKPNPAGNSVTFYYTLPESCTSGIVELYDNSGKSVKRITITNNGTKTIDCSGLPSGIYFYRCVAGNTVSSGKLVIKH